MSDPGLVCAMGARSYAAPRRRWSTAVAALLLFASSPALAVDWTGGTGDWFDSSNWSGSVPGPGNDTGIDNGGTAQIEASDADAFGLTVGRFQSGALRVTDTGTLTVHIGPLRIGRESTGVGELDIIGPDAQVTVASHTTEVGGSGQGQLTIQDGGTLTTDLQGRIGTSSNSYGLAMISGAGSTWTMGGDLTVGWDGEGQLLVADGASVRTDTGLIRIGRSSSGTGTLQIGNGAAAGFIDVATITGGSGTSTVNFNHTDLDYWFTHDGTADGDAI
ncbi:hypothetical protein ACERK3_18420, partial [Phycisphaerales bacterium AB-hyl4]